MPCNKTLRLSNGVDFDKGTGWMPELPSKNDWRYSARRVDQVDTALAFPNHMMAPRFRSLPINDQGSRSSCTGEASSREWARERKLTPRSALFPYWYARKRINETDRDEGAYIRDVIDGIAHEGVPRDDLWPDVAANLFKEPSPRAEQDAEKRLPIERYRLDADDIGGSREQIRARILACLLKGHGFVTGVTCYNSFFEERSLRTGLFNLPNTSSERPQGGHAIAFGEVWLNNTFKDTPYAQEMRNRGLPDSMIPTEVACAAGSWGKQYLLNGYHYCSLEYIIDRELADDTWTMRAK